MREADTTGSAARLERAFKEFVQKGSLISHMEAALRKIPRDSRAWYTKFEQLFEGLDLEYLADGFITDMKMALEEAGDSSSWTADTVRDLEKQIKKSFEKYRKEAQTQLGEGNARPLVLRGAGSGGGSFGRSGSKDGQQVKRKRPNGY
ncbi:hypothetical protein KFL_007930060 [Klebsormidium nitens]|uniref:Uncharacterized protein n=1 Tax=Klebsormidium nitens TaxID=105231 RepID=A0A1Y1ILE2_KLENI|nr:hypothetical protein KFL_007930060 [Klebsormidium nitens]|eukprot:GAQ91483.1 hypothetical protein KFL_007930060 [Klebsormidium nitens]